MSGRAALCYYCDQVKPIHAWGLCTGCYTGIRRNPDGSYLPKNKQPEKKCKICGGKYLAIGLCRNCYMKTPEAKARTKRSKDKPENKIKARKRSRKRHWDNREENLKRLKDYWHTTRKFLPEEKERQRKRTERGEYKKYREENPEKVKAGQAEWRKRNPDYQKEWAKKNPSSRMRSQAKYASKHAPYYSKIQLKQWGDFIKYLFPRCIICGSTKKLEAHHVKPRKHFPELALAPDNGVTLCHECHISITNALRDSDYA